ncbi:MAG: RNA polymerase sigma factor [Pirellulaceae bacterium]
MDASDAELIAAHRKSGSKQPLEILVSRHLPTVHKLLFQMVLDHSTADDLTQEAFLRAFRGLPSFGGRASFSTWLHRIALNTVYDHFDRCKRSPLEFAGEPPAASSGSGGPEQAAIDSELAGEIETALGQLSPKLRAAIVLTSLQQLEVAQAAELEGCSTATMYWRIHEARKQLKQRLGAYLSL